MRRPGLAEWPIVVILLVVACTCAGPDVLSDEGVSGEELNAESAENQHQKVVFIFDPTIFQTGEAEKLEALLSDFRSFCLGGLRTDTNVALFVIDRGTAFSRPEVEEELVADVSTEWERRQKEDTRRVAENLIEVIRRKWREVHQGPERPRTCIASTLDRVREYVRANSDRETEVWIVLITDLLEVCDEWGEMINMEEEVDDVGRLRELMETGEVALDFSGLNELIIVQVESQYVLTPLRKRVLRKGWLELFKSVGIEERVVRMVTDFPSELERIIED